jgi:hypothetical protein
MGSGSALAKTRFPPRNAAGSLFLLQNSGIALKLLCQQNEDPIKVYGTGGRDTRRSPSERGFPAKLLCACHPLSLISHRHSPF